MSSQSLYYGNQWNNQHVVPVSGVVSTASIPGLNIGSSGVAFTITSGIPFAEFAATTGTITVSGVGVTINGGTSPLTVSALTGKCLYNYSGTDYVSF